MKTPLFLTLALLASPVLADPTPADGVKAAAKKLSEAANYSWTTNTSVPEGSRFRPGPVQGKIANDGFAVVTSTTTTTNGDRTTEAVLKGGKSAIKGEAGWQTPEERRAARAAGGGQGGGTGQGGGGRGGFGGRMFEDFKNPAQQAEDLAGKAKDLKAEGDAISGTLTDEAVKSMLTFGGRRREGADAPPAPTDAMGTVKFWLKDGTLVKFETHVSGKMSFNGNDVTIDRTATTEIKDVGSTKVEVPEEAKKKIESAPEPSKTS